MNLGDIFSEAGQFGLSALTLGHSDIIAGALKAFNSSENEDKSWYEKIAMGLDRAMDPAGMVDRIVREAGTYVPEPIRSAAPVIGGVAGGIVGSYVPVIGTAAGAAIGTGLGSKVKGDDYAGGFLKSGMAYVGGKGMEGIGGIFADKAVSAGASGVTDAEMQAIMDAGIDANLSQIPTQAAEPALAGGLVSTPEGMAPISSYAMGGNEMAIGEGLKQATLPVGTSSPYAIQGNTYQLGEYAKPIMVAENVKPQKPSFEIPWKEIGKIGDSLTQGGTPKEAIAGLAAGMTYPVDIDAETAYAKSVTNEGLSKASKASSLYDDYTFNQKKAWSGLDLKALLAMQNWNDNKKKREEISNGTFI